MPRLFCGFYKDGTRSKCLTSLSFINASIARLRQAHRAILSAICHSQLPAAVSPAEISHARLSLFTWATNLAADHAHCEIYGLTVVKMTITIFEHLPMVDAQIVLTL